MESTLSNLNDSSPSSATRHKFSKSTCHLGSTAPSSSQNRSMAAKTFAESSKALSWTQNTASMDGVFTQHVQAVPPSRNEPSEDHFGDFQSGPDKRHLQGMPGQSGGMVLGQSGGVPGLAGGVPGHSVEVAGQPGFILGHSAPLEQHFLSRNVPQGHAVSITTANQRPVPSTSISGWTTEGYISSDVTQSHSCVGRASINQQQPEKLSTNFASLDASKFPAVYMEVYRRCGQPGGGYVSTDLVFPLLLSSQLPQSVLGDLWSSANRGIPGKLSQTELFVLLGLIALVQVITTCTPSFAYVAFWRLDHPFFLLFLLSISLPLPLNHPSPLLWCVMLHSYICMYYVCMYYMCVYVL